MVGGVDRRSGVVVGVREQGGVVLVDLEGKLMGGTESDPLREEFRRLIDGGARRIAVNLSKVPWMNSSGLGVLLAAYIQIRKVGGELRFVGLQDRVRGILTTTKLVTMIPAHETEEEALRAFGAG